VITLSVCIIFFLKKKRFRTPVVKQIIQQIVNERLEKAIYNKDQAPGWANEIAEEIKKKLLGIINEE